MRLKLQAKLKFGSAGFQTTRFFWLAKEVPLRSDTYDVVRSLQRQGWRLSPQARPPPKSVSPLLRSCSGCGCSRQKKDFAARQWARDTRTCLACTKSVRESHKQERVSRPQLVASSFLPPEPRPAILSQQVDASSPHPICVLQEGFSVPDNSVSHLVFGTFPEPVAVPPGFLETCSSPWAAQPSAICVDTDTLAVTGNAVDAGSQTRVDGLSLELTLQSADDRWCEIQALSANLKDPTRRLYRREGYPEIPALRADELDPMTLTTVHWKSTCDTHVYGCPVPDLFSQANFGLTTVRIAPAGTVFSEPDPSRRILFCHNKVLMAGISPEADEWVMLSSYSDCCGLRRVVD